MIRLVGSLEAALVVLLLACSPTEPDLLRDDETDDEPSVDFTDDAGANGEDTDRGPASAECEIPVFEDSSAEQPFEELRAQVVDPNGAGIPDLTAQACAMNLCLYGATDAGGFVLHRRAAQMRRLGFKYGDGFSYAQFVLLVPEQPRHELGRQFTVALPDPSTAPRFEPGVAHASGGAVLTLADDAHVGVDTLSFPDSELHVFLASELPRDAWPDAVPTEQAIELVFALGPLKTDLCPAGKLELPNTPGWDPGERVEILLHVTDTANQHGLYGDWAVVATATVDAEGEMVVTDEGSGIPQLGVIGVRSADSSSVESSR